MPKKQSDSENKSKNRYKRNHKTTLTNLTEMGNKDDLKTENKK